MTHFSCPRASRVVMMATALFALACSSPSDARVGPTNPGAPGSPSTQPVVASVTVVVDSTTLAIGHTSPARVVARDAAGTVVGERPVVWWSSNSAVATVADGFVSAVGAGSVIISAVIDGVTGSATLSVPAPTPAAVATVTVAIDSATLAPGHSAAAHAVAKDASGNVLADREVTWASSNASVATVAGGIVVGATAGTASISATIGGVTASASVVVVSVPMTPASVASVAVTVDSTSLLVGHSSAVHAVPRDSAGNLLTGRATTWASSNASVATVSSGVVTARAAGTATLSATVGGMTGSVGVTVTAPPPAAVATVTVTLDSATLLPGSSSGARVVAKDANGNVLTGRSVTWSSGNTAVATVASAGLVTAVAVGSTSITATVDGTQGRATVTVTTPPPAAVASVTVTINSASMMVGHATTAHAVAKDASGNVLSGRAVAWTSSHSAIASVNGSSGVVTGVAAGTAKITATVGGVTNFVNITIAAAPPPPPPPPPTGSLASECGAPGSGWIFCDDFESDRTSKYFEYDNSSGKFVRASSAGVSGSTGMRATYTPGQSAAGSLKLAFGKTPSSYFKAADAGTASYREMYWRFYLRLEPGWVGDGAMKLTRITSLAKSDWSQAMIAHGWSGSDTRYLILDPASGTDEAGTLQTVGYNDFAHLRWLGTAQTSVKVEDQSNVGKWMCLEFHVRLNDAGQSNGVFDLKLNGTTTATKTGLNFLGAYSAYGLNAIMLENFVNDGAPAANVRTFDNFVVSTQPIGCPPAP
jgi:uncharacterized protein YjdB